MARRKAPEVVVRCLDCKEATPRDEAASTEHWDVTPTTCPFCGGKTRPFVGQGGEGKSDG